LQFHLTDYVPFLVNRIGNRLAESFAAHLEDHQLTIPAWRVLAALYAEDGQRIGDIAVTTSLEAYSVSRLVTRLAKRGLVRRKRETRDTRAVDVYLTDRGRSLAAALIPIAHDYETMTLRDFSEGEKLQLRAMLERLYRNLVETEAAAAPA
jgi:DNA-binding MarR family transcriptional regulator